MENHTFEFESFDAAIDAIVEVTEITRKDILCAIETGGRNAGRGVEKLFEYLKKNKLNSTVRKTIQNKASNITSVPLTF